jgi:hypothetical protein
VFGSSKRADINAQSRETTFSLTDLFPRNFCLFNTAKTLCRAYAGM